MVNDWPVIRKIMGGKIKTFFLRIFDFQGDEVRQIHRDSFPVSMELEYLRKRADFLGVLEFENDTFESFKTRIVHASFWWESAGVDGQFRQVLNLLMGEGNWKTLKGRTQAFRIGYFKIGNGYVGQVGAFIVYLKNPTESQHRDVEKYLKFAVAPYLQWSIVHYKDDNDDVKDGKREAG